jgi:hypothetical protein
MNDGADEEARAARMDGRSGEGGAPRAPIDYLFFCAFCCLLSTLGFVKGDSYPRVLRAQRTDESG